MGLETLVNFAIFFIIVVVVVALIRWAAERFKAPEPVVMIAYAVLVILCLLILLRFIQGWNFSP